MNYKRRYQPGGTYFFTLVTHRRFPVFRHAENIDILRQSFRRVIQSYPFTVDAIVILPDHLHCIWTLPPGEEDFSTRWRLIKSHTTKACKSTGSLTARHWRNKSIWQNRFWEHLIRDQRDLNNHINYVHYNPVKHGYVKCPIDWTYSSIHKYIRDGILSADWRCRDV